MIIAYALYAIALAVFVGMPLYAFFKGNDVMFSLLGGALFGCLIGMIGLGVHAAIWESKQPAYVLPKYRWSCTDTKTEVTTIMVPDGNGGTRPQITTDTVCVEYRRR